MISLQIIRGSWDYIELQGRSIVHSMNRDGVRLIDLLEEGYGEMERLSQILGMVLLEIVEVRGIIN